MEIYQAIILGIVQGLTELLPISSSAHLYLIPWLLNWNIPEAFDVALHFGTLLAIGIFFFKDWIELIKGGYNLAIKKEKSAEGKMFWYIVLATIPGGIIGFVLDKYAEGFLQKPIIIAISLMVMGIVLYIVDKYAKKEIEYKDMSIKQTFLIGLSQALAFIPGVSRSGITMTTGRALHIKREAVATILKITEFQFNVAFLLRSIGKFYSRDFSNKIFAKIFGKRKFQNFCYI